MKKKTQNHKNRKKNRCKRTRRTRGTKLGRKQNKENSIDQRRRIEVREQTAQTQNRTEKVKHKDR